MEVEKLFQSEDESFQTWFMILLALLIAGDDKLLESIGNEELKRYAELLQNEVIELEDKKPLG
jgi:hypothetical protein